VETESKLDQIISSDEQQDQCVSDNSIKKDEDEDELLSSTEDEEDRNLKMQDYFYNMRNLKGKERDEYIIEYDKKEAERDKKFADCLEPVVKKHVILENILASHDATRIKNSICCLLEVYFSLSLIRKHMKT
jgi:hypothetical protein